MFPGIGSMKEYKQGKFEFKIIPDEQTPELPELGSVESYIVSNKDLLDEFLAFAENQHNGVGLASNQCSVNGERFSDRVIALKDLNTRKWRLIFNPKIVRYFGIKEVKTEGCLTWIGRKMLAERYLCVEVSYYDFEGNFKTGEIYTGFEAQMWQHEIDHLNGVEEKIILNNPNAVKLKIGNNDICPCGSGKKYKKCCKNLREN